MQLFRAIVAFWQTLLTRECEHKRLTAVPGQPGKSGYCPDCGYKVAILWTLCRCRTCGSKRHPRQSLDGRVSPLYKYCQHCGQSDYQLIKKDRINVHEMPYAILNKEINYVEERLGNPRKAPNPFEMYGKLDIVEGEVLHKQEIITPKGSLS